MFDGLNGMDWLFIAAALALGFGAVKFMLVAKPGAKPAVPSVLPDTQVAPVHQAQHGPEGLPVEKQTSAGGRWELSRIDESEVEPQTGKVADASTGSPIWFELLDIPRTASAQEIDLAFTLRWSQFGHERLTRFMTDLTFIADGGLETSMPKQLRMQSMMAAVMAQQLKSMLERFLLDMQAAREEGLMRRRQGHID